PFVFGIEGDATRQHSLTNAFGANAFDAASTRNDPGWIGTVRPRAGLAADNWLFYGTAGLAYGTITPGTTAPGSARSGWAVGGGLEFESGKQWSLGLEYLYADFGKTSQAQSNMFLGGAPTPGTIEDRSQVVRGRLNYRF